MTQCHLLRVKRVGLSIGFYNRKVIKKMSEGECEFVEALAFTVVRSCPVVLCLLEFKNREERV